MACHICQAAPEELDSLVTYLQNAAPITLAGLQASLIESDASAQQQQALTAAAAAADNGDDHGADTTTLELLCAEVLSEATQCKDVNSDTASSRGVSPSPDDVADDVANKMTEASQCSLHFESGTSSDQPEQLAVGVVVGDTAANAAARSATAAAHSSDVVPANTSAGCAAPEVPQLQQLQQPTSAAVAQHNKDTAHTLTAPQLADSATAALCSVELLSHQLQHATVYSADEQQQFNITDGVSEAMQHSVAVYALEFLLSDVMYELVNDVADSALLQRLNMLVNAADYANGPLQAHLQQAKQQCGGQLNVQQTLQQLQHCIDDAIMIEHSDVVAAVQHLKQQLEDMYTKNTGTLTDAQVLQVWSAAQREKGRAARFELALARTAVAAATQQQQQQCDQSVDTTDVSGLASDGVSYEAPMLSQYSERTLSNRSASNGQQADVASCAPPIQRRASRFSAVPSQYSVLMGGNSSSSSSSSSSDSGSSSQNSSSNDRR
jgi:hypothetical protein